jgi:hypothetical protein
MSNQTKLRTVYPNNSLKAAFRGVKESKVYYSDMDFKVPLEDVMFSSDVKLSLKTGNLKQFEVRIPASYKIISAMWIDIKLANQLKIQKINHWLHHQFESIRVQYPGVEDLLFKPADTVLYVTDSFKDDKFLEKYKELSGSANSCHAKGSHLLMFVPLIMNSLSPDEERKPLPNHKIGESIRMTFTAVGTAFMELCESIELHWTYADLAESNQYMQLESYDYPLRLLYSNEYAVPPVTLAMPTPGDTHCGQLGKTAWDTAGVVSDGQFAFKLTGDRKRKILLTGLRPGETQQLYLKVIQTEMCKDDIKFKRTTNSFNLSLNAFQRDEGYIQANGTGQFKPSALGYSPNHVGSRISNISIKYAGQNIFSAQDFDYEIQELNSAKKIQSYQTISSEMSRNKSQKGLLMNNYVATIANNLARTHLYDLTGQSPIENSTGISTDEKVMFFTDGTNVSGWKMYNQPWLNTTYTFTNPWTGESYGSIEPPIMATPSLALIGAGRMSAVTAANALATGFAVKETVTTLSGARTIAPISVDGDVSCHHLGEKYITDYVYEINFAQKKNSCLQNEYSMGVDFSYQNIELEFEVDSDDPNLLSAEAENAGNFIAEVTQSLQSQFKFLGQTVTLIQ